MENNIGYLLSDSGRLLRKTFDERVRDLGLTAVQARLMLSLVKFPDNNQAFYAERIEVEPITDPNDRRARLLHLTDKSREIVEPLRAIVNALVEDMAEGLTSREQDLLAELLGKISANLSAEREYRNVVNV